MNLDNIDPKLWKRIAHRFDLKYFDYFGREWGWVINRFVSRENRVVMRGIKCKRGFSETDLVIYLPNHRSHYDYLVLGYMFWEQGMKIPRFAAGENLFFWPFDNLWRKLGAYAVDRGNMDWNYRKTMVEYVTHLVVDEKCDQIDFVGGGRSYTGRLQEPKLGLLGVVWKASQQIQENVVGQPVFLDYDPGVIEEKYFEALKKFKYSNQYWAYVGLDLYAFFKQFIWPKEIKLSIEFGDPFSIKKCKSKKELGEKVQSVLSEMACESMMDEFGI